MLHFHISVSVAWTSPGSATGTVGDDVWSVGGAGGVSAGGVVGSGAGVICWSVGGVAGVELADWSVGGVEELSDNGVDVSDIGSAGDAGGGCVVAVEHFPTVVLTEPSVMVRQYGCFVVVS